MAHCPFCFKDDGEIPNHTPGCPLDESRGRARGEDTGCRGGAVGSAMASVIAERKKQDEKWGEQDHDPFTYLTILGEEFGETCQAALHLRFNENPDVACKLADHLREEAVQTAAVALAIVECLDRSRWGWPNTDLSHTPPKSK